MTNQILKQFVTMYQELTGDQSLGADPTPEQLQAMVDRLTQILVALGMMDLDPQQRQELQGKRTPDMPSVMIETGEALRACPQIKVAAAPEDFEFVGQQDLAVGSLVRALLSLYSAADTGLLLRIGEAARLLDDADSEVKRATTGADLPPDQQATITNLMADPMARRVQGEQRAQLATQRQQDAVAPDQQELAGAMTQEELSGLVQNLGALEWLMLREVLEQVVARLESPDCTKEESEQLQDRFSGLLLNKQYFLLAKEQQQQGIEKQQQDLQAQVTEVQQRTQVADIKEAIRRKQPLDLLTLQQTAMLNRDLKAKQAEAHKAAGKTKGRRTSAGGRKMKR